MHLFFLSPIIVFFFQQRGLDYFQILFLESVLVVFVVLFEIPTGIFADTIGRKKSIVVGTLLIALEPVVFLFADNFFWFAFAFAMSGIGIAFHSGSIEALMYDNLHPRNKEEEMKKSMGSYGSASLIAMIIAPIIGSFLAKDLLMPQFILLILLTLGAMLTGFVTSLFIKDSQPKKVEKENPIVFFKCGVRLIGSNKSLLRIVLLSTFASPFLFAIMYLYQPYFKNSGVSTAIFGIVFAFSLLLAALLQRYAYKVEKKFGGRLTIFLSTILPGIFYVTMAFTFHPIWAILLFVLLRGTIGLQEPLFSAYKNVYIPSKNRATVLSLISMLTSLYLAGMMLIIGKVADINVSYSFLFMGTIIIIASILLNIKYP